MHKSVTGRMEARLFEVAPFLYRRRSREGFMIAASECRAPILLPFYYHQRTCADTIQRKRTLTPAKSCPTAVPSFRRPLLLRS